MRHPRAKAQRNGGTAIRAAIVGDEDFTREAQFLLKDIKGFLRITDADGEPAGLVEAGHDNADVRVRVVIKIRLIEHGNLI